MTRDEYIDRLKEALAFLEEDARGAALTFYTEMLDDRMEDGMDEAAAVDAMDSPETIAQRLKCEHGKPPEQEGINMEKIMAAVGDYARQAAEDVIEATEDILSGANTLANAAIGRAEGAYHAIRDEIKKGEEGDYDQHIFTCAPEGILFISLIAQDMPIRIFPSPDDQIHLTYYSHPEDIYTARVDENVLQLYPNHPRKKRGPFSRPTRHWWQRLRVGPAVELALPKEKSCALYANSCNAAIHLTGLKALESITLETSNARITAENILCQAMEMNTCNAPLALYQIESQSCIRGKTSNGRITGEKLTAAADIFLHTSNGNMHLAQCSAQEGSAYMTSNGGMNVQNLNSKSISLRTNNGSIRGTLPGPITAWKIDSSTSNGRNSLPGSLPGEKPLSVYTSNGNIDIIFE